MIRWLKLAAALVGALLLLFFAAAALTYGWLQTEGGRRWVEARLSAATGGEVLVEGLEGALPFRAMARRLSLADAQGVWLTAEDVRFSIRPSALLRLHAEIEMASAARIAVARRPEPGADAREDSGPTSPPRLPLSIEVERLSAPEIHLARPVLGEEARLSLTGSGALSDGSARLELKARRLDAPGDATVELAYDGQALALEARVDDPGGLAAHALGAEADVPATLRASGEGPLRSWIGTVEASLAEARSRLSVAVTDGRLTTSGSVDPRPLLQPRIAALLPEPLRIEAVALLGERRTLERIVVASGPTRLSFEGALRLEDMTGSGQAQLAIPDAAVLQPLLGIPLQGAVSGTADIDTAAAGQTARLVLSADGVAARGYEARSVTLEATAHRATGADAMELAGTLKGSGIAAATAQEAPVLPADLTLAFEGTISPRAGQIVAQRLSLTGEGAEIAFAGTAKLDGLLDGTIHIAVPRLAPFAQLARLNWDGAVMMDARLAASPGAGTTRFEIEGAWREPTTGIALLDPALGTAITLSAAGSARYDGALEIDQARAQADAVALSLSGRIAAQGPFDARFELIASQLGAFGGETPLSGAAQISGSVIGTAAAPRLQAEATSAAVTVSGTELRDLSLSVDLVELRPILRGSANGHVTLEGVRAEFGSDLALEERVLSLAGLRIRGNGGTVSGDISLALDGGAAAGALEVDAPDLAPWSELARLPLSGSARGTLALEQDGSARAELTGSRLTVAETRIETLRATAALARWRGALEGRIDLAAEGIAAGAAVLDKATLRLDPKDGSFPLRFTGTGRAAAPFALDAQGVYEPDARRLKLAKLTGTYAQKPVTLRSATALTFGEGLAVAPFDLAWGGARIGGELAFGTRLSGTLRAAGLPVQDLAALSGRSDVQGTARATLAFSGTRSNPTAELDATISDLAFSGEMEEGPAGDLNLRGVLGRSGLDWQAKLSSGEADLSVSASGTLPVAWSSPPFGIAIERAGPLRARVEGSGEIAPLIALVGVGEDRASGRYTIDLRIAGSLDAPTVSGSAAVQNGFYENFASGAQLHQVQIQASGARDRLQLTLSATDGEDGRIEGSGSLRLSGASVAAMDLTARLLDFRAIRRDDVRARATGDFALAGPLDEMVLSGRVRLDRMSINLPEQSRVSAPVLDVIEVNAPAAGIERVTRTDQDGAGGRPAFKIGLNIDAELPRVEVAGRGLRSEWHGAVSVAGTTVTPQISGEMRLDRGTFTALGKTFSLTEGLITFGGGPELDPSIRVIAEREVRDAVARATLTGSLSSPLLDFSARPELPVDEVLARLLFDKGAGQVGAAEALQLAQVAAALRGGGTSTGIIERLGQKFGLDRIDISTVETVDEETGETGEAAALSLGKDISEDVRVGVEQGIQPGTGSVTVEVDLGKNLSVESRIGAEGRSGVGLKWEYDY